ncbi:MAG: hypothetical protein K0S27_1461 [Gammaproteobacteria bacterium]|nr:hypothetical protein [Gammaproteobacteria bacterium]
MRATGLIGLNLFLLLMTLPALAMKVDSLYKSTVPVTTQGATERSHAVQEALSQVLIKVSGSTQILSSSNLKARLGTADTLIQQMGYITPPSNKNRVPYLLEVQFDPMGIHQWLRDAGIAEWDQNRPLIIAWIAYEAPGHPSEIVNNDLTPEIATLFKQNAEQYGLPLILPLMDMTDFHQISTTDVIDGTLANLTNAAKRYASDAMLIGQVTQASHSLVSRWKLVLGDQQWEWNLAGQSIADIAPPLMTHIMTTLATRFAIITTNTIQKDLLLKVTGITHYPDFAQLTRYLTHLPPVANVEIIKISPDNDVILKVSLRSNQESFIQALSVGQRLIKTSPTTSSNTMVVYQWNP